MNFRISLSRQPNYPIGGGPLAGNVAVMQVRATAYESVRSTPAAA